MNKKRLIIIVVILGICVGGYFYWDYQDQQKRIDSITLNFNDMEFIEYGQKLTANDLIKDYTGEISYQETVDTFKIGQQEVKFIVKKDGHSKEFTHKYEVKDTRPPEILFNKEQDTIKYGAKFDMTKYIKSVKDLVDGDIPYKSHNNIKESDINYYTYYSDINTKKPKDYKVQVVAVDKNQNKTEKTILITVNKEVQANTTTPNQHYTPSKNKVIVIDAGHQAHGNNAKESVGPGSSTQKAKVTTGATGVSSGKTESQINLEIALKLRNELQTRGYTVIMTRTSQNVDISNQQRAQIGNKNNAAAIIHLHCDSIGNSSTRGASALAISKNNRYCPQLYNTSSSLAKKIISSYSTATGIKNRGVSYRDDLTGLNWSQVPAVYIEMGFISNSNEDRLLSSSSFQNKCAQGIANGFDQYFQ